jgi:hypothetical protein
MEEYQRLAAAGDLIVDACACGIKKRHWPASFAGMEEG